MRLKTNKIKSFLKKLNMIHHSFDTRLTNFNFTAFIYF